MSWPSDEGQDDGVCLGFELALAGIHVADGGGVFVVRLDDAVALGLRCIKVGVQVLLGHGCGSHVECGTCMGRRGRRLGRRPSWTRYAQKAAQLSDRALSATIGRNAIWRSD